MTATANSPSPSAGSEATPRKLAQFQCPHCLAHITRKRGNLRNWSSFQRAVQALLEKHVTRCSMRQSSSQEPK